MPSTLVVGDCRVGKYRDEYTRSLLGVFENRESNLRLRELARRYRDMTEAFDRTRCTGRVIDGGVLPANGKEAAEINQYARRLYRELLAQAVSQGFSPQEFRDVLRAGARRPSRPGE